MTRLARVRAFLAVLLFEPGAGWLRWGLGVRASIGSQVFPPDYGAIAPPARRVWATLQDWAHGYHWKPEVRPTAWTYLKDPDRGADLRSFAARIFR